LRRRVLEIQDYWLREAKSRAGETLRNVLDILVELMYIEPAQFILEFLQNSEDALMEARKEGYFRVGLFKDKVVISNNGKPFDESDLDCLCGIRSSKKPSLGYKGFVGIGWKSVYKISSHVEVHSGRVSFEFSRDYWSRPAAQELLRRYGLEPKDVLWQVTPIPTQPIEALPEGVTSFVIHLDDEPKYYTIARAVDELGPSILLFLDYVSRIEVLDRVRGRSRVMRRFTEGEEEFDSVRVKRVMTLVEENGSASAERFLVFKKEFTVPENVRRDPLTGKARRSDVVKREVALAFSLRSTLEGEDLKPLEGAKFWGIYSFLPLHEVRTGLKFLIQADFIVHPGRRYLNTEAKWNHWLMGCVAELVKDSIRYLQRLYKRSYLSVLDYRYIGDEVFEKLIRPYIVSTIDSVLSDPLVVCIKGHEVRLSFTVRATEEVLELIKYGLLSEEELKQIYGVEKHILDPNVKLRERDVVPVLDLKDLLSESLIKAKLSRDPSEAISFLGKVYKLAYKRSTPIPPEKRYAITSSRELKLAFAAYLPRLSLEVEDLRRRFPEIDEYLKTLDLVHEGLVNIAGTEVLKWLGVRDVDLKELVEKVILKQISVESPAPRVNKLLAATALVKKSGVKATSPILVLTKSGAIRRSNEVWYPVKLFEGLEDAMRALDVEMLDIDSYIKYDPDTESWRSFFTDVVRGLRLYDVKRTYYGTYCIVYDYVYDLIDKIRGLLEEVQADINVKLVRLLKRLYDSLRRDCSREIDGGPHTLRLVRDDGGFALSNECLLHDAYGPKERWSQWRERGFPVGPFVSPKYLENPSDPEEIASWREFFTRILGVMEEAGREVIERFAEWFAERKLMERSYRVVGRGDECDLRIDVEGEVVCVEVKGRRGKLREIEVGLPVRTLRFGERYWLVVVEGIPNDPRAWLLRNPGKLLGEIEIIIPGKLIEERGELL